MTFTHRRTVALTWAAATALVIGAVAVPAEASAATPRNRLSAGSLLKPGAGMTSANGRYHAFITARGGQFVVVRRDGSWAWRTPRAAAGAHVTVSRSGSIYVRRGSHTYWSTSSTGSGSANRLTLGDNGVLSLTAAGALVWSSRLGSGCGATHARKSVLVDISQQLARVCQAHQQVRLSRVTTGASAHGDGTPTGRWRVQAKVRGTVLHPAGGGAYRVHYWVPYNGAYGMHDSPWQRFAYGSSLYRTKGSHGCVHFPGATMRWLFGWIRVGSTVQIRR